jgi:hypothetical protein
LGVAFAFRLCFLPLPLPLPFAFAFLVVIPEGNLLLPLLVLCSSFRSAAKESAVIGIQRVAMPSPQKPVTLSFNEPPAHQQARNKFVTRPEFKC